MPVRVFIPAVLVYLTGCAHLESPPVEAMSAAQAAIAGASEAYSPGTQWLRIAQQKVLLAERLAAARENQVAAWLAEQARIDAELSGVEAPMPWTLLPVALKQEQESFFDPRRNVRLAQARSAFEAARALPQIEASAPHDTQLAKDDLDKAELAWASLQDPALVDHLAYIAHQRLRLAHAKAFSQNHARARAELDDFLELTLRAASR